MRKLASSEDHRVENIGEWRDLESGENLIFNEIGVQKIGELIQLEMMTLESSGNWRADTMAELGKLDS